MRLARYLFEEAPGTADPQVVQGVLGDGLPVVCRQARGGTDPFYLVASEAPEIPVFAKQDITGASDEHTAHDTGHNCVELERPVSI